MFQDEHRLAFALSLSTPTQYWFTTPFSPFLISFLKTRSALQWAALRVFEKRLTPFPPLFSSPPPVGPDGVAELQVSRVVHLGG